MTCFQELGADLYLRQVFVLYGFIMIPCMSDFVEEEIQRLGASLSRCGHSQKKKQPTGYLQTDR